MTLPALISEYKTQVTVSKLRSTYSIIANAFNLMISENGDITSYGNNNEERIDRIFELLPKYLKTTKICKVAYQDHCVTTSHKMRIRDTSHSWIYRDPALVLSNGTLVALSSDTRGNCLQNKNLKYGWIDQHTYATSCGLLWVDINVNSKPNIYDLDTFKFTIYFDGIVPAGRNAADGTFEKTCIDNGQNTIRNGDCTAWVLQNENMDYLHCNDLSWNGKKNCK